MTNQIQILGTNLIGQTVFTFNGCVDALRVSVKHLVGLAVSCRVNTISDFKFLAETRFAKALALSKKRSEKKEIEREIRCEAAAWVD